MAFQGNHRTFSVPDLLAMVLQHNLTGMLVVTSPARERTFYFREGQIVYALCHHPEELLGQMLVREHGLEPALLTRVTQELQPGEYLGAALRERGLVTEERLETVLAEQIRRAMREVLQWREWAFHFQPIPAPANLPGQRQSTQRLVFDLARELDEWRRIAELFPDLEAMPQAMGEAAIEDLISIDPGVELLDPAPLLALANGRRTLRHLLEQSGLPVLQVAFTLESLVRHGVLQLHGAWLGEWKSSAAPPRISALTLAPTVPARVQRMFEKGTPPPQEMVELLGLDPVLAVRALRLASLHGWRREGQPIGDDEVAHALTFEQLALCAGTQTLHSLLLAETVRTLYLAQPDFDGAAIWTRAYRASLAAGELCDRACLDRVEMARLAALIQDIGRLVLATLHVDLYREVEQLHASGIVTLEQAEQRFFHTTHTLVGAQLAEAWGFPPVLRSVVRDHHRLHGPSDDPLLDLVRLANQAVSHDLPGPLELPPTLETELLESLSLTQDDLEDVRRRVADGLITAAPLARTPATTTTAR